MSFQRLSKKTKIGQSCTFLPLALYNFNSTSGIFQRFFTAFQHFDFARLSQELVRITVTTS